MARLGKTNTLVIVHDSDFGFYLDGGDLGEILLPNAEVPEGVEQGDEVEVFVSRDSEDRLVATIQKPVAEVGQFAALEVTSIESNIGAFLDWGLTKDLLLPFREQPFRVRVGQLALVYITVDEVSNRIIASARTKRYLDKTRPDYQVGEAVEFIIRERTPLGYMCIVNQQHSGLLHESRISRPLKIGEPFSGYIAAMKPGDKIDLSLEPVGYGRVTGLSGLILEKLKDNGGSMDIGDKSSPDEIRRIFQTSKKAFKQALGALYRKRLIEMSGERISLAKK